jgi:hypothetical protein
MLQAPNADFIKLCAAADVPGNLLGEQATQRIRYLLAAACCIT